MMVPVLVGGALFAHGLIHLLYALPGPDDPNYPFTLDGSWYIPESARRRVRLVLVVVTVLAFSALASTVWSVGGLDSFWKPLTIIGSVASLGGFARRPSRLLASLGRRRCHDRCWANHSHIGGARLVDAFADLTLR
jgi:hypothetical protein